MKTPTEETRTERALAKLDEWERHIEKMTPGDQALIAIAKGAFQCFLEQHGMPGRVAVQLSMLAEVINDADPTILQ